MELRDSLTAWAYTHAVKLAPKSIEPRVNLGLLYETVGSQDRAIEAYEAALSIRPDNAELMSHLARAKIRAQDGSVRILLNHLADTATDPELVQWARHHLAQKNTESE